jgi:hypothetical protein
VVSGYTKNYNQFKLVEIRHLKHNEIDFQKWDETILNACNSLVYAESWYLDIVSPNWEALILGDYEYVMPLPVKRKFGVPFLVQPPLTQQLGVFSSKKIDENIIGQFIKKIPYRSYHLSFNEQNPYSKGIIQPNLILDLNKDEQTIFSAYSTNTKRNIKKAQQYNTEIKNTLSANEFLEFYHSAEKNYPVEPEKKINKLLEKSFEKGKTTLYGAYNQNDELISALCLLHSPQRLIYLLPVSNDEGKESLAMFKIVNDIIKNHANSSLILDFEGSKIENVAHFYQGFGAEKQSYSMIKNWSINDFIKHLFFWK